MVLAYSRKNGHQEGTVGVVARFVYGREMRTVPCRSPAGRSRGIRSNVSRKVDWPASMVAISVAGGSRVGELRATGTQESEHQHRHDGGVR